jgi:hypothetical protein
VRVVSRKVHDTAGTFDVDLPLTGSPGIECRNDGSNTHQIVFTFPDPVTFSSATVTHPGGTATVGSTSAPNIPNSQVTVNLTGVSNVQTITVNLLDLSINGGAPATFSAPMGVLFCDTTANRSVNSSDVSETQAESGHIITNLNFRDDVTANGAINSSDVSSVQGQSGTGLLPAGGEPQAKPRLKAKNNRH